MVVYLVSPNILNKKYFYPVLWFYDYTVKLELNKVLFI